MHHKLSDTQHVPVLLSEVLSQLDPQEGESYLDATAGYGGHADAVLARTKAAQKAVLVDRDENAVTELQKQFGSQAEIRHGDFLQAARALAKEGKQFDLILADLGVSSPHLNTAARGFSFASEGPLDMRMDLRQALSAEQLLNTASQAELADIFRTYGEEPKANKIAADIVAHRPLTTTTELATIVAKSWPGHSKIHPASRVFQALRIAVNDELGQLSKALPLWLDELLAPQGRIAVISFHSLEDRLVKQAFAERAGDRYDASLRLLTKTPLAASNQEIVSNPRARSAKLRAAVKIKT